MIGTIVSKALGLFRELSVAYKYGAGSISDAFILTNGIPNLIFSAFAIAISINFIPCYTQINGKENQDFFTSNLINLLTCVILAGCILVCFAPKLVLMLFGSGLSGETEAYATIMLRIVVFSSIPIILASLFQSYCQANGEFLSTAVFGIVVNTVVIFFTYISSNETYYLLSIGTLVANIIGMIIAFLRMKKSGFVFYKVFSPRDKDVKLLIFLTIPLLAENIASNLSLVVDRNLASFLDSGTISGLSYAGSLSDIAGTMIATSIITATFPRFSKLYSNNDKSLFSDQLIKCGILVSLLLTPISVFMIINAGDIVSFIFEHGAFESEAAIIVKESVICYSLGVLPMGLQTYLIRAFYAMKDTKTPVKIKVFSLSCNVVLNLLLVQFIQHKGIAISTSFSYFIAFILLSFILKRKYEIEGIYDITKKSVLFLMISILFGIVSYLLFNHFFVLTNLFLKLLLEGTTFILLYSGLLFFTRKEEIRDILEILKL